MEKLWQNKEWLENEYKTKGSTSIAREFNIDDSTIIYWLRKFKIKIRSRRDSMLLFTNKIVDYNYFDNINSPTKAYWLGYFLADATMREYRPNCYQFVFEIKDHEMIDELINDINFKGKVYYKNNGIKRLIITNNSFCQSLMKHNIIPNKTGKEKYPNIQKELNKYFIR